MPVKPPKCRTCGKEEWRHICRPKRRGAAPPTKPKPPTLTLVAANPAPAAASANGRPSDFDSESPGSNPGAVATTKPKTDRKEYLRLKAVERRARQKAEREAEKAKQP